MRNHSVKFKSFKFSVIIFSFYLSVFSFSGVCWSLDKSGIRNPAIRNPVGSPTVPQSSVSRGLIRSPNPMGINGNLIVTGNVGGGKHFRGVVPYNALSDFGGNLGSSSLDSFLRRSGSSSGSGYYTGKLTPYFLPRKTVTTTRLGQPNIIRPTDTKISGAVDTFAMPGLPGKQTSAYRQSAISNIRFRPMSVRPEELQSVFLGDVEKNLQRIKLADEQHQHQEQIDRLSQDLKRVSDKAAELKQDLLIRDSAELSTKLEPGADVRKPFEMPAIETPTPEEQKSKNEKLDVYEQMKKQSEDLQKIVKQLAAAKEVNEPADGEKKEGDEDSREEPAEISMSVSRAKAILGEHKSFASFSKDKFNQYMMLAENYLKHGRYYRAADAYTLASVYKPGDPLAYAGKSHSLFAAGEYMSSALFLSRALDIFPEYAQFKIDLVAMVGDKDTLESRIADVEEWLERNDVAELEFLLGYIYYQMGRPDKAKKAIEAAYGKMPDSPAVIALKKVIDN
ncbi:MAG: hypothetical protein DRP62_07335 [Planctomycetota bacterium]|nr:MAG: hypothetical protein DRP62_07335 [Planctomycetota bacterium]